jgi:hypothetical protein
MDMDMFAAKGWVGIDPREALFADAHRHIDFLPFDDKGGGKSFRSHPFLYNLKEAGIGVLIPFANFIGFCVLH